VRLATNQRGGNMNVKQKIKVNITDRNGEKQRVLTSTRHSLPQKILRFLFGDCSDVLVLMPGQNVQSVEIQEIKQEGEVKNG
jgi:hypothetical protein